MSNFNNRGVWFVVIAVFVLLILLMGMLFWTLSKPKNVSQKEIQSPNQSWQIIQEPQLSLFVPPDWQIEKIPCWEEQTCSNILLKKDGFFIRINTNVLFTGGGVLGNYFSGACGNEYSSPVEINGKLVRLDALAPSDCVLSELGQTTTSKETKMWTGSTITNKMPKDLSPYFSRADNFQAISPSYFNQGSLISDENGKYLAITYGYEGNMPNSSASLPPKILTLESPELQRYLLEMDKIVATFQVNPNFNFTN